MRLMSYSALALAAETTHAYLDTSPFFMFSTSEVLTSSSQLQSATSLTSDISLALSQCPSNLVIIVSQSNVRASDYTQQSTPTLSTLMAGKIADLKSNMEMLESGGEIRSSSSVADVVGRVDTRIWQNDLESNCGAEVGELDAWIEAGHGSEYRSSPRFINVRLSGPESPSGDSEVDMRAADATFADLWSKLDTGDYTVLWTTTPPDAEQRAPEMESTEYEMESPLDPLQEAMHMDLKRDLGRKSLSSRDSNQTIGHGDLFEKYQFLSPGIFMGFTVGIILLLILYVGISALASLQVTYAAFDKESGALATKKQS